VFTSHPVTDNPLNSTHAEIYVINPDGTGRHQLTFNEWEERAPSWSPDGTKIAFCARIGGNDFEICVMNADGSGFQQLTSNSNIISDLTPSWSPDGTQIAFQQFVPGQGAQIFTMNPELNPDGSLPFATQVTFGPDLHFGPQWGEVRTHVGSDPPDGADETFFAGSQADYSIQNLGRGLPDQLPAVQVELPNDTATEHIAAAAETIEDHIPDWFALGSVQTARALDHPPSEIPPPPPVTPSLPDEALSVLGGLPETAHIPDWLIV
jgi:dipeptidyl aminopeptidase/acylaminoacyl peptidase